MCGIHCVVSQSSPGPLDPTFQQCLRNRGPDHLGTAHAKIGTQFVTLTSTVLSLRGDSLTRQPFLDAATGAVFCWNGEAWRIRDGTVSGNDGAAIFNLLLGASASAQEAQSAVLDVLRSIDGPFAFLYLDTTSSKIYYGRDRLGRRSLLTRCDGGVRGELIISSLAYAPDLEWTEVEADGIYVLDLAPTDQVDGETMSASRITLHPWVKMGSPDFISGIGPFNMLDSPGNFSLILGSPSVRDLRKLLSESLAARVQDVPAPPHIAPRTDTRIAILFSGGLDCTVLARLVHDLVPAEQGVDLLNVAFENPRVAANRSLRSDDATVDMYEACPDRITGRKSFGELLRTCPSRAWRFVTINIPYTETTSHRETVISLMHPHNTEMDLSIAYALYFAARGEGLSYDQPDASPVPHRTTARVLLSGLGADELFGGYARHGAAFSRQTYVGLAEELKLDVSRLGKRNLGRDDRVMANWGKEVRFPYLDERLVRWAMARPAWEKCDFHNPGDEDGGCGLEPGKRVLRLLALELGMEGVAREKKRAIQFGARTAKMESGRTKGTTLIS